MNEQQWLECREPGLMFQPLMERWSAQEKGGEAVNQERLRLFACACCRRVWELLGDEHRRSVEMLEEYARTPTRTGLRDARRMCAAATRRVGAEYEQLRAQPQQEDPAALLVAWARILACGAVEWATEKPPVNAAGCYDDVVQAIRYLRHAEAPPANPRAAQRLTVASDTEEKAAQAVLFREIIGNPFRFPVIDPAWLKWNDRTVETLAQAIHDTNDFGRLPVLADALLDAGCTEETILSHCRGPGPHGRGCWVVDVLRGRY